MMPVSAREIVARVAREHDTTVRDIFSHSRFPEHVLARWNAVREIHQAHPTWSMARIARFMRRDHSTILHVFRKQGLKAAMTGYARKRPWPPEDIAYLLAEWPKGTAYRVLEVRLRRSASTIRRQVDELGLTPRPTGPRARLTDADVREIRASSETKDALAQKFGISPDHVRKIRSRQRLRHVQ